MFTPKLVSLNLILESLKMCHAARALQVLLGSRDILFFLLFLKQSCSQNWGRRDLSDYNHLSPGRRLASPPPSRPPRGPVFEGVDEDRHGRNKLGLSGKNAVAVSVFTAPGWAYQLLQGDVHMIGILGWTRGAFGVLERVVIRVKSGDGISEFKD